MTLIICAANRQFAVLVSDRRLTRDGLLGDDESNKATTFACDDARFAVAFTGLARWGSFSTDDWLVEALAESAKPSHLVGDAVPRLGELATRAIGGIAARAKDKRLSVVLVGYHHGEDPPRAYCLLVSNYDEFGHPPRKVASSEFTVSYLREARPTDTTPALVVALGHEPSVRASSIPEIGKLLKDGAPAQAIREKALHVVREAADSPASRGLVGKQATSVVLPSDPAEGAIAAYHPDGVSTKIYLPNHVVATSEVAMMFKGIEFGFGHTGEEPFVPRVGRNERCPCGSGKKYKRCHGALPSRPAWTMQVGPSPAPE